MGSTVSDAAVWPAERVLRSAGRGEVSLVLGVLHLGARPATESEGRHVETLTAGGYLFDSAGIYLITADGRELLRRWQRFVPMGGESA